MYREQHDYWSCLHKFLPGGFVSFEGWASRVMRHFIRGKSQVVRGLILLFFSWGKSPG